MIASSSDDRTVDLGSLGPVGRSAVEVRLPLCHGLLVDPVALGKRPQALLTILYRSTHRLRRASAPVKNLSHSASFHSREKIAPSKHGIKHLAEELDQRLIEAWPRGRRPYDRTFDLLRRAYVEARYSKHYEITKEELEWLADRVRHLQALVETVCTERLAQLKAQADKAAD